MSSTVDWIDAKRRGLALGDAEIQALVAGFVSGDIPDYQMSAWLMAVCVRGMDAGETLALTRSMVASGETLDWSSIGAATVDKHSTGGVGDKVSLVLVPIVAAAGVPIPKMSGHALGHTGGTIDKLESIPGFRAELSQSRIAAQVRRIGGCICSQSRRLSPADRAIYALRDVTATVASIPLIASSIMSKKIACGADAIVLDVKAGAGAFMKTANDAKELAGACRAIADAFGKKTALFITDMDEPVGREVGNYHEVREALDMLAGRPVDAYFQRLTLTLAGAALRIAGSDADPASLVSSGAALAKFDEIVRAQGGSLKQFEALDMGESLTVTCKGDGFVQRVDAMKIARIAGALGAGRRAKRDSIDPMAAVSLCAVHGDYVTCGDALAVLRSSRPDRLTEELSRAVREAFTVGSDRHFESVGIVDLAAEGF